MYENVNRSHLRKTSIKSLSNKRILQSVPTSPRAVPADKQLYSSYCTPRETTKKSINQDVQGFKDFMKEQDTFSLPKLVNKDEPYGLSQESTCSDMEKTINLQYVVDIEKCLYSFYSRYGISRSTTEIQRYFELIEEYNNMNLHFLYQDKYVRAAIRQSICLEITATILHWFFVREKLEERTDKCEVRSMLWTIYQNFLILIDYILQRLPSPNMNTQNNKWVDILKKCPAKIDDNLFQKSGYKQMNRNCWKIAKLITHFCEAFQSQFSSIPIFRAALFVSKSYKRISPKKVAQLMSKSFSESVDKNLKPNNEESTDDSISVPFLPPATSKATQYTLVLDLDETLVHCWDEESLQFLIRPGCKDFLKEVAEYYEVAVFTAGLQYYADAILDDLDPDRVLIKHRLYRGQCTYENEIYVKDLSKLGRPLNRTVIVDNTPENFKLHRQNGIFICSWYGNKEDSALPALAKMLIQIAKQKPVDIRCGLKRYQEEVISKCARGRGNHRAMQYTSSMGSIQPSSDKSNQRSYFYSPQVSPYQSPGGSPQQSPYMSPYISPYGSPQQSPHMTPQISPHISPNASPKHTPNVSSMLLSTDALQYDATKGVRASFDATVNQQVVSYDQPKSGRISLEAVKPALAIYDSSKPALATQLVSYDSSKPTLATQTAFGSYDGTKFARGPFDATVQLASYDNSKGRQPIKVTSTPNAVSSDIGGEKLFTAPIAPKIQLTPQEPPGTVRRAYRRRSCVDK